MNIKFRFWDHEVVYPYGRELRTIETDTMNKADIEFLLDRFKENNKMMDKMYIISTIKDIERIGPHYMIGSITLDEVDTHV